MFNISFLKILNDEDEIEKYYNKNIDLKSIKRNLEGVKLLSPSFLQYIKNPQELIETTETYYVAKDKLTDYLYICFKNLMMIDIDINNYYTLSEKYIKNHFSKKQECYRIFKSRNGFHVFCVSKEYNYRDLSSIKTMLENFSDYYYSVFCFIRGWSVRLNKKEDEIGEIYTDLGLYGDKTKISNNLLQLTDFHMELVDKYSNTGNLL